MTPRDATWGAPGRRAAAPAVRALLPETTSAREAECRTPWAKLRVAVASARGADRRVNEDAHTEVDRAATLVVVADGVGGGAEAARASRELVVRLHSALDGAVADAASIRHALLMADRAIARSIATRGEATGASTVVLAKAIDRSLAHWLVAWVGDCRAWRVRAGDEPAELLTVDDTYRNLAEAPPPGGSPDDPARMVGNGAVDLPNVRCVALEPGERIVLASDGVHKHVDERELALALRGDGPLAPRCHAVVDLAHRHGSRDDATVLVVERAKRDLARSARRIAGAVLAAIAVGAVLWWSGGP
ncbi:MAG TPA: protein phosphatase 2C domain-containing protein [Casimicrobiaceae bacterium]|jgi:protein phosphatase